MAKITGVKRETTLQEWQNLLEKYLQRAEDSMECFRRFKSIDDLDRLIEDCQKVIEYAKNTKEVIEFMDAG